MNRADASREFERWLDRELRATLAAEVETAAPPPRPRHRLLGRRGLAGMGVRGAAAVFAVVLGVASGGAALATGSPNPVSWGREVVQVVSGCADQSSGDGRCLRRHVSPTPTPDVAPAPAAARSPASDTSRPQPTDDPPGESPDVDAGKSKPPDHGAASPPADQGGGAAKAHGHAPASSSAKSSDS
jgi:hypothetical protein